ncbi:MAG: LysR family transcriptional regulator [Neisseria sp.]|nr:LysR family transcriptional regulator [Neisseria sp.]
MLDDMALFAAIADAGSLNRAAQQHGIPAATLTRRLQKLETQLGCRLLHRSSRGLRLTAEGAEYYERCAPLLAALQQTAEEIRADIAEPRGRVRLLAPVNLAVLPMMDFWADFLRRFPEIRLDLQLDNRAADLLTQGADLALRVGKPGNPAYMQRRLASVPTAIVAAPEYLAAHAPITAPQDLYEHDWLLAQPLAAFTLRRDGVQADISIRHARMQANEIRLCMQLAVRGLGLAYLPQNQCRAELDNGSLVQVLPQWQAPVRDIYAVWLAQKNLPARVRVLLDEMAAFLAKW